MNTTGWLKGSRVTGDGTGIMSHAGVALIRGRVLANLGCAIADGGEVISDFRVIGDQEELFGLVASVPTVWRTLDEIARGGERA